MRKEAIGAVIAILIVASSGVVYLAASNPPHTVSYKGAQPIPVATVETGNYSLPGGTAYALDSSTNRMFILGTSSLTVVDMSSHSVIATVELPANNIGGANNAGLAVDLSTGTVYASVQGEVVEVNGSANTILGELPLSFGTLAFEPTTHMLWGTEKGHWALAEVDPRTGSVVANVSIGFAPYDIAVDPGIDMVYSDGCNGEMACDSWASVVNGTSGTLVAKVELGSGAYPTMALDPATHVLYVSGDQLAAINGTTGGVIFKVNPRTCGPFTNVVVDPSANFVYTAAIGHDYLLAYDGATGKLMNMYSFSSIPVPVALNPNNGELYLWTTAGPFISIRVLSALGNVNGALIGEGQNCTGIP
jgi:DNA-binding beta-propeller fold protein YncE